MVRTDTAAHHRAMERSLRRPIDGRLIAGVAAGVADYFDIDVVVVRIALAVLALAGGLGIPLYVAAWLLVPDEGAEGSIAEDLLGGPLPGRAAPESGTVVTAPAGAGDHAERREHRDVASA